MIRKWQKECHHHTHIYAGLVLSLTQVEHQNRTVYFRSQQPTCGLVGKRKRYFMKFQNFLTFLVNGKKKKLIWKNYFSKWFEIPISITNPIFWALIRWAYIKKCNIFKMINNESIIVFLHKLCVVYFLFFKYDILTYNIVAIF